MLLMQTAAGGPRHYESETAWPGRSLDGVKSGGPRGHSRYVPLSYCGEGGEGGGTRQDQGTKGEVGKKCNGGQTEREKEEEDNGGRTKTEQPKYGRRTRRNERKGTKENRIYRAKETFVLIMRMSIRIRISQKEKKINKKRKKK